MPKVLIADALSPRAVEIFKERGVEADVKTGLKPDELLAIIDQYDGLAIRSSTKVTKEVLAAAARLKVVGRAGIGVDNVDIPAATGRGVVVMNTPFGNSITTAEHAIAMMFALARDLPTASASTHAGKWEKNRFMGVEVTGKVLGVVGCGNIGGIVAERGVGLKMKVIAFDPFLTEDRARVLGVEKVDLDTLLARADFITLHVPMTEQTKNILSREAIAKTKKGVRIINCARGGLVDEAALKDALDSGHVAGAALDVFAVEPAKEHPLFGNEKLICTPHLGASTNEAQENVALQVAEQISDFLMTGAVTNALNAPSVSAEDAPKLKPYMKLAEQLGCAAGQLVTGNVTGIEIDYEGQVAGLNLKPLTALALSGILKPFLESVNTVNAASLAKDRGIAVTETRRDQAGDYQSLIRVRVLGDYGHHLVEGTLFGGVHPRLVSLDGIAIEAEMTAAMLFVRNQDRPGFIGRLGAVLGDSGVNIATFHLGRPAAGKDALALLSVDGTIDDATVAKIKALPNILDVRRLSF
jgi:D-3-phosphoglycerate dehydrogenase / 2-oxoglutarate reductase